MAHLSAEEFKELLLARSLEELTETYVFGGLPYYFRSDPQDFDLMRRLLAQSLGLSLDCFDVVGSGKTGFSLDPKNPFIPFHSRSDIDVLIVDAQMFDRYWYSLLAWAYPLQGRMGTNDKEWWYAHKNDISLGKVNPGFRIPRSPALPHFGAADERCVRSMEDGFSFSGPVPTVPWRQYRRTLIQNLESRPGIPSRWAETDS